MSKQLQHFGVMGMHWGVRRGSSNSSGGSGRKVGIGGDGRKKDKIFGKRNRTAIKNKVDEIMGKSIGLKKISDLKKETVEVNNKKAQYLTTVALATFGAWKLGEFLAQHT